MDCRATIWVIDDDESVRRALKRLLKSLGFKVETFASAQDFLDYGVCEEGLLILDIQMPEIDGFELQKILSASGNKLPVIFITAHEHFKAEAMTEESGAVVAFLQKPFDDQSLLNAINKGIVWNQASELLPG